MGRKQDQPKKICQEPGCDSKATCRGLCRSHYGKTWRQEKTRKDDPLGIRKAKFPQQPHEDRTPSKDSLRSLYRSLKRAREAYKIVTGMDGRKKWRADVVKFEADIKELELRMHPDDVAEVKGVKDGN